MGTQLLLGVGGGAGAPAGTPPWTPTSAVGVYDYQLSTKWQNANQTGAVAADGDPVGWLGDLSAALNQATQATAANRPLWRSDGFQCTAAAAALVVSSFSVFTGAHTVYCAGSRAATTDIWTAGGYQNSFWGMYSDNQTYFLIDANTPISGAHSTTGTMLFRMRRSAANVVYFARTGLAEVTLGTLAGNATFAQLFSRSISGTSTSGCRFQTVGFYTADLVATGEAAGVEQWFAANRGLTLG